MRAPAGCFVCKDVNFRQGAFAVEGDWSSLNDGYFDALTG